MTNAGTLYGLNLYLLCLTNPVGMVYNGYTIETNAEMSYEPDELTDWQNFVRGWKAFWNSPFGKYLRKPWCFVGMRTEKKAINR